ncbi:V-SNARE coiled-coil-like proteiny domain-containing protein [Entamoeba marina]
MSILYGLAILKTKDTQASVLYSLYNMEGIRLYQYHTMKEFITFGFCEIAERCEADKRMVVKSEEYGKVIFNVLKNNDGIGVGIVTTASFPKNIITYLIHRSFEFFYQNGITNDKGDYVQAPKQIQELDMLFKHFSSQENTKLSKAEMLQTELDETNEQMEILVSDLVERGENIEDVVVKSEILSKKSKDFFVKAKKSRRCHFCGLF